MTPKEIKKATMQQLQDRLLVLCKDPNETRKNFPFELRASGQTKLSFAKHRTEVKAILREQDRRNKGVR